VELTVLDGPKGEIKLWKNVFSEEDLKEYHHFFLNKIDLNQGQIRLFGKTYQKPRLEAFFHAMGKSYTYSNETLKAHFFPPTLTRLRIQIEELVGHTFNSALVNVYRNGFDSNGWHADNEKELGPNPIIGSVSFGSTRAFVLKHNTTKKTLRIPLCDGDVLWMGPSIQVEWKHCIPKQPKTTDPRINVTFRTLYE